MKIGVLSMQRIYNYGSWLQAYALKSVVESFRLGNVQFVDYRVEKPATATGKGRAKYFVKSAKIALAETLTSRKIFATLLRDEGIAHVCRFKREYQKELFGELGLKRNYAPVLDRLIVGSDEVFNCLQENPRVGYSKELFGVGARAARTVSYAASFGNTTYEKIRAFGKEAEIASWLGNFERISVRDRNSFEIVERLTGRQAEIHLDPALIYDFSNETRADDADADGFRGLAEPYLIVYAYANRLTPSEIAAIRDYAAKNGLKIVGFNGNYPFLDKCVYDSPRNVLRWFAGAERVVTDTFHGTIFSVINRKPFATIVRQSQNGSYGNREKLGDLLERLVLTERAVDRPERIGEILDAKIEFGTTDEIVRREKERSRDYLSAVLR